MADSNKLAAVVALLAERDQEFKPIEDAARYESEEPLWPLSELKKILGYRQDESIENAVNRAKIAAGKAGWTIKEHFRDGSLLDSPGELFVSKYAAYMITTGADVSKMEVATALTFFALSIDKQRIEDEKRLRTRLDVATENGKLQGAAKHAGVQDFQKFNGMGVSALYGGLNVTQIKRRKGLAESVNWLDFAGSEELAANLFRITQTSAALRRQDHESEAEACGTHETVARGIRKTILAAGNRPPEQLPAAKTKIDLVATKVKKQIQDSPARRTA